MSNSNNPSSPNLKITYNDNLELWNNFSQLIISFILNKEKNLRFLNESE